MRALVVVTAALVMLAVVHGVDVRAHEIGTTRVSVRFEDDRRYEIEVVTDAAALLEKLETIAGRQPVAAPQGNTAPAALKDRIAALDTVFRQRVAAAFDGAVTDPVIEYAVAEPADLASPPLATIRLSGDVPAPAEQFTWTYGWTFASYALSLRMPDASDPATEWLEGGQTSAPFSLLALPSPPGGLATAWRYLVLGFTHIVPHGLDHVLFVLGIFLLSRSVRSVLWQVSAFTFAHSITLALSIYGVIALPPALVEPLIAVSIGYVAIENLCQTELRPWRVGLVFAFGLLHGMGFAGVLSEIGLPRSEYLTALITFNLGVEAGQLAVIAAAFAAVGWYWNHQTSYRRHVVVPVSLLIACAAVYWTVERVAF